jgi:hypothetical protein
VEDVLGCSKFKLSEVEFYLAENKNYPTDQDLALWRGRVDFGDHELVVHDHYCAQIASFCHPVEVQTMNGRERSELECKEQVGRVDEDAKQDLRD